MHRLDQLPTKEAVTLSQDGCLERQRTSSRGKYLGRMEGGVLEEPQVPRQELRGLRCAFGSLEYGFLCFGNRFIERPVVFGGCYTTRR